MSEEQVLPPNERPLTLEELHNECASFQEFAEKCMDERDALRASLAQSEAERERLQAHFDAGQDWERRDCVKALVALAGAHICTPAETYGTNSSWAISDLCRGIATLAAELARERELHRWRDVKQELPPFMTPVWAWDGSDTVIRFLTKSGWRASLGGAIYQISYWMPYKSPEPPALLEDNSKPVATEDHGA